MLVTKAFHFDLKTVLLLMTTASFVCWAVSTREIFSVVVSLLLVAAAFAWNGATKGFSPAICGSFGGGLFVVLFVVSFFVFHFVGYYCAGSPPDYFEDGMEVELLVFPPVYILIYTPIGASLGIVCGFFVGRVLHCFRKDFPHDKVGVGVLLGAIVVAIVLSLVTIFP